MVYNAIGVDRGIKRVPTSPQRCLDWREDNVGCRDWSASESSRGGGEDNAGPTSPQRWVPELEWTTEQQHEVRRTTLDAGTGVDQTAAQMGEDKIRSSSLQRWVSETVLNRERN